MRSGGKYLMISTQSFRGWMRLGCVLLPLIGAGCGEGRRAAVEGEVTYDGQPVVTGTLRLFPLDGTAGFGAETGRFFSAPGRS